MIDSAVLARLRWTVAAIGMLAWPAQAVAQAVPPSGVTLSQTPGLNLPATLLPELRALEVEAYDLRGRTFRNPDAAGSLLVLDDRGEVKILTTREVPPGELAVPNDLLERWKRDPQLNLLDRYREWIAALQPTVGQGRDHQKSVPPGALPTKEKLPPGMARDQALANGWTGVIPAPACASAQAAFNGTVEQAIKAKSFEFVAPDSQTRATWVSAIAEFDAKCLVPVAPGSSGDLGTVLGKIAILFDDNAQPICTALHVGNGRFLTARHCFLTETGSRISNRLKPKLIMADRSSSTVEAVLRLDQPFGNLGKYGAARDLVVLEAAGLPAMVKARVLQDDDFVTDSTIAEPAMLIGYFPLADPAKRIPEGGKQGQPADWAAGLRMTNPSEGHYCRVWDRSTLGAAGGCLEHSCQSIGGFSGAPLFVKRGTQWRVVGLNAEGAGTAQKTSEACGTFRADSNTGLLDFVGAVAALLNHQIAFSGTAIAMKTGTP